VEITTSSPRAKGGVVVPRLVQAPARPRVPAETSLIGTIGRLRPLHIRQLGAACRRTDHQYESEGGRLVFTLSVDSDACPLKYVQRWLGRKGRSGARSVLGHPSSNAKDFGEKLTALVSDNLEANLLRTSVNHRDLRW